MATSITGRVKAPSGKTFEVKWDSSSKQVYIAVGGWSLVGKQILPQKQ